MTPRGPAIVLIGPPGAGKSAVGPLLAARFGVRFRDTDAEVEAVTGKPVGDIFVEDGEEAFRELEREAATGALREQSEHGGVLALGSGAVLDQSVQRLLEALAARGGQGEQGAGSPRAREMPGGSAGAESPRGDAEPSPRAMPSREGPGGSSPPAMPSRGGLGRSSPRASTVIYLSAGFGTVARRIGLDRPRVMIPGNPRGRLRAMLDERDALYQRLASTVVATDDQDPDELAEQIAAGIKE